MVLCGADNVKNNVTHNFTVTVSLIHGDICLKFETKVNNRLRNLNFFSL